MEDEILQFVVTPIQTNCYVYASAGECIVVDPGGSGAKIAEELGDRRLVAIVCTHGHGDHVGGVAALKAATGAPYLIHEADADMASHAGWMPELLLSFDDDAPAPDGFLSEGDVLTVGTASFTVVETPGHTLGGICLVGSGSAEGVVFTGDTLFAGSIGRTDLDGGDYRTLMASLDRLERELPPSAIILSGHGPSTTMERELATNPFLQ